MAGFCFSTPEGGPMAKAHMLPMVSHEGLLVLREASGKTCWWKKEALPEKALEGLRSMSEGPSEAL